MPVDAFKKMMEAGKRQNRASSSTDPYTDDESATPPAPKAPKVKKLAPVKERFDWLIEVKGDDGKGRYFCAICSRDPVILKALGESPEYFSNVGVEKSKDPGRKAEAHAAKASHQSALSRAKIASGNSQSAVQALQEAALKAYQKKSAADKTYVKEYIKLALWCASNEIPHTTVYEPLINLVSSYSGDMLRWAQTRPDNAHYRSKKTAAEIIGLCAEVCDERASRQLRDGIERFGRWALMVDETSLYGQSIMGVFARFISGVKGIDTAELKEELILCCPLESTNASVIEERLIEELELRGIDEQLWKRLGSLSCDGAASMSSDHLGLFGRLKARFELEGLQFQHCRAHRVNLAAKAVLATGDHLEVEDAISLTQDLYVYMSKSNKKTELFKKITKESAEEDDPTNSAVQTKFLKLVEAGGTRWLSHNNSLKRLIRVYVRVARLLDRISEDRDYDGSERSRARGLLVRMLSKRTIVCISVVSDILDQLAILTKAFQATDWTLDRAVDLTTVVIGKLESLLRQDSLGDSCENANNILNALQADGFEIIDQPSRLRSCRARASGESVSSSIDSQLHRYLSALIGELRRRFSDDCKLIAYLEVFNHPAWVPRIPAVARKFGFDCDALMVESRSIGTHIGLVPHLRDAASCPTTAEEKATYKRKFWLEFCADNYSRNMFPEHLKVASFLLTCPISSSNVERAFSYTTRIDSNIRAALSPTTVCQLVRIAMQSPKYPTTAQLTWPPERRSTESTTAESCLQAFIDEVFQKWFHSNRRINCD